MGRLATVSCAAALLLAAVAPSSAQPGPAGATYLEQGWSDDDRSWFYTVSQGSQLMPYFWFLALERPGSETPFLDDRLSRFGYLPPSEARVHKSRNPDGLPVGFALDNDPERGPWVGMTCAACHTNRISFPKGDQKVLLQIDGGPTDADFFELLKELDAALQETVASPAKFDRFAAKVASLSRLPASSRLRRELERFAKDFKDFVTVSKTDVTWGPARLDAFGEIFNRATAIDLNLPENNRPPNAPVSFPFLWDTSWHDRVQWNGAAQNRNAFERLARNVGEVLGVFAHTEIKETILPPLFYKSSVDRGNLLRIENRLRKLSSPRWPEALAAIDRRAAVRGKQHYDRYCLSCHAIAKERTAPDRSLVVTMTPLEKVGTDPLMATNASTRESKTGVLEGVRMPPIFGEPLGANEKSGTVTTNIVIGTILAPPEFRAGEAESLDDPTKRLMRAIDALDTVKRDLRSDLRTAIEQRRDLAEMYRQAAAYMGGRMAAPPLAYKARPLNGIWATAPYLHNGSVPNLYQVLLPAAERDKTFRVGSRELDTKDVGFRSGTGDGSFTFDTSLPGNSNRGHEGRDYGTEPDQLTPEQRRELLEYELEVFERGQNNFAPEALKRVHPLGRAPVIRDGDTVMVFPFTTLLQFRALDLLPYPAIQAYLRRIEARPAYRKAMELAGPGRKAG